MGISTSKRFWECRNITTIFFPSKKKGKSMTKLMKVMTPWYSKLTRFLRDYRQRKALQDLGYIGIQPYQNSAHKQAICSIQCVNSSDGALQSATSTIDHGMMVSPIQMETMTTMVKIFWFQLREFLMYALINIACEAFINYVTYNITLYNALCTLFHAIDRPWWPQWPQPTLPAAA